MFKDAPISMEAIFELFEHSEDCVKLLHPDGTIAWVNQAGVKALDYERAEDLTGRLWQEVWPDKAAEALGKSLRSDPATSNHFTAFGPTHKGTPKWWDVSVVPVKHGNGSLYGFLSTARDVTERMVETRSREVLLQEMRHRQGNTLSLASSLMTLHSRNIPEVTQFVEDMSSRLAALGRAQSVLGDRDVGDTADVDLENLLSVLVRPLVGPECDLVLDIEPGTYLDSENLDAVGMVLSELAVNSAKHGAFSHGGRVALSVSYTNEGVEFTWQERSDKAVTQTAREQGQGQSLMARIASVHDGTFEVEWRPRGQLARLVLAHRPSEGPIVSVRKSSDTIAQSHVA